MEKHEITNRLRVLCPIKPTERASTTLIFNNETREYQRVPRKSMAITEQQLRGGKALVELLYEYINK